MITTKYCLVTGQYDACDKIIHYLETMHILLNIPLSRSTFFQMLKPVASTSLFSGSLEQRSLFRCIAFFRTLRLICSKPMRLP